MLAQHAITFHSPVNSAHPLWASLSPRERDVLSLWAQGYDAAGIAAQLVLMPQTVYNLLAGLRSKFDVSNNIALLLKAQALGLVAVPTIAPTEAYSAT